MKKWIGLIMVSFVVLSLVGCNSAKETEVANPFIEYETIDEAIAHVDFDVKLPTNMPTGYELEDIRVIENELIELVYTKEDSKISYRQGKGTEDISGDYNTYDEVVTEEINDYEVTLSGKDSKINLAVWTDGTCSYAVNLNVGEAGMDQAIATSIVEGVQ